MQGTKARSPDRDLIYLLQLARKYNVAAEALHDSLLTTWRQRKAQCGELMIELRLRGKRSSTYMFSVKGHALSQADIKDESVDKLTRLPDEFSSFLNGEDKRSDSRKLDAGVESEIGKLRYGFSGVSLKARVVKKSEVRAVTSKDGTALLVCDITLSDGTGEIPLAVWNNQIGTVSQGDLVRIENARVRSFRGEIQLSLSRKVGVLTVLEPASKEHHAAA
jgi:hypothetical protein